MSEAPNPAPPASTRRKLFVVRGKLFGQDASAPFTDGRMKGAFTTEAAAQAFLDECEAQARVSGDYWPLYWEDGWESLLKLTSFDPPVFRDWLEDSGIPLPPQERYHGDEDVWLDWLRDLPAEKLTRLYEGLHHFSFHEILEVDWLDGPIPPGFWEEWEHEAEQRRAAAQEAWNQELAAMQQEMQEWLLTDGPPMNPDDEIPF
jgi:hypothetical protein